MTLAATIAEQRMPCGGAGGFLVSLNGREASLSEERAGGILVIFAGWVHMSGHFNGVLDGSGQKDT